jgi:hypothetical protein
MTTAGRAAYAATARSRVECLAAADALYGAAQCVDDDESAQMLARLSDQCRAEAGRSTDGLLAREHDQGRWTLNGLAAAVSEWHARELPGKPSMVRVAKVAEETGEMIGAHIKAAEPDRQDGRDRLAESWDEWADVVISAMGAAEALGIADPDDWLARRWKTVSARRFATRQSGDEPVCGCGSTVYHFDRPCTPVRGEEVR